MRTQKGKGKIVFLPYISHQVCGKWLRQPQESATWANTGPVQPQPLRTASSGFTWVLLPAAPGRSGAWGWETCLYPWENRPRMFSKGRALEHAKKVFVCHETEPHPQKQVVFEEKQPSILWTLWWVAVIINHSCWHWHSTSQEPHCAFNNMKNFDFIILYLFFKSQSLTCPCLKISCSVTPEMRLPLLACIPKKFAPGHSASWWTSQNHDWEPSPEPRSSTLCPHSNTLERRFVPFSPGCFLPSGPASIPLWQGPHLSHHCPAPFLLIPAPSHTHTLCSLIIIRYINMLMPWIRGSDIRDSDI